MVYRQGTNGDGEVLSSVYVEHDPVDIDCSQDGRTRQEFADECDINVLMQRYETTGVLNAFNMREPQYLDVSDVPDLQASLAMVAAAETAFMTLPAKVRREFDNDPVKFVAFAQDPANLEQMREWDLAPPAPVGPPVAAAAAIPEPPKAA
ncbi:MAG: internal scaffolding protein [Microvirus sp.]|nr:MAG: internal scaffolding protein [Microvirus sp.]